MKKIIASILCAVILCGCTQTQGHRYPVGEILQEIEADPDVINTDETVSVYVSIRGEVEDMSPECQSFVLYDRNSEERLNCQSEGIDSFFEKYRNGDYVTVTGKLYETEEGYLFAVTELN